MITTTPIWAFFDDDGDDFSWSEMSYNKEKNNKKEDDYDDDYNGDEDEDEDDVVTGMEVYFMIAGCDNEIIIYGEFGLADNGFYIDEENDLL